MPGPLANRNVLDAKYGSRHRYARDRRLSFEKLERRRLLAITSVTPVSNSHEADVAAVIQANFDLSINSATVSDQTLAVHAGQTGRILSADGSIASLLTAGTQIALDPAADFHPGEIVQVTVTDGIRASGGTAASTPYVWQFQTETFGGTGTFNDSNQALGAEASFSVSLGDLDRDGDLDAFVANSNQPNRIWLNQGGAQSGTAGTFLDSGQELGNSNSNDVSLGDLDGDGDLDAFVANAAGQANRVWLNQGGSQGGTAGVFSDSGQTLGSSESFAVSLGDVDGDGDLDAMVANFLQSNRLWLNQGGGQGGTPGMFSDSGLALGDYASTSVSLGDLDGDGDLDAYVVNLLDADRVWVNQGGLQNGILGQFVDSGQALGESTSNSVALGDLDGDGDLDAFLATGEGNQIWWNQGGAQSGTEGTFADSSQSLGDANSFSVALGDLDGDGDLDAFIGNLGQPNHVWLNQGGLQGGVAGVFGDGGQSLGNDDSWSVALGDMDADGDLDAFVGNALQPNRVWLNENSIATATIEGRHIFYNNSSFDNAAFGNDDDTAIDPTKSALLPGQTATKVNYISYTRGINGIMVDIANVQGTIDVADFEFHDMGRNGNAPSVAPSPDSITVRPGEGVNGSDRIALIWDTSAGAVFENTWLRVTVGTSLGLEQPDVFYFGSAPGEGSGGVSAEIDGSDEIGARNNPHAFGSFAAIDDQWDYNKDRLVDGSDRIFARNNATSFTTRLNLFTAPLGAPLSAKLLPDKTMTIFPAAIATQGEIARPSILSATYVGKATGGYSIAAAADRIWSEEAELVEPSKALSHWSSGFDAALEDDVIWLNHAPWLEL